MNRILIKLLVILCVCYTQTAINSQDIRKQDKLDLNSTSINYYDPSKINTTEFKIQEDNTPFKVVEYSPIDELPALIKKPTLYVLFSQAVVPISKLGSPLTSSNIMKIVPDIKGTYRWYGTRVLAFEPAENYLPQREYQVLLSDDLKSLGGKALTGMRSFKFHTEYLNILKFNPTGEDIPLNADHKILVEFNHSVNLDVIKKYIKLFTSGSELSFSIGRPGTEYYLDKNQIDRFITLTVNQRVADNSEIIFNLEKGARSEETYLGTPQDIEYRFRTLLPFQYTEYQTENYVFPSGDKPATNPVYLAFSHPINEKSAKNNISVSFQVNTIEDHITVYRNFIKIFNLPVTYNSTYTVTVNKELEDIYGRKLGAVKQISVQVPAPMRSYHFPNTGTRMLEAAFAPKIIYEYQNVFDGIWKIGKIDNPYQSFNANELGPYDFSNLKPNTRHFEVLDLSPYLNDKKKGFVGISWNFSSLKAPESMGYTDFIEFLKTIDTDNDKNIITSAYYTNNSKKTYWLKSDIRWDTKKSQELNQVMKKYNNLKRNPYEQANLQLQVTDLGITTRYAYNKILVWVNYLSTGKPVKQARVSLKKQDGQSTNKEAVTDNDGLAEIPLAENEYNKLFYEPSKRNYQPRIFVTAGADKVDYIPDYSHNVYHFNVYNTRHPNEIGKTIPSIFLFTDRGIYRPGETVTYRGIDRDLKLGEYTVFHGPFQIEVGERYNNTKVIYKTEGKTSDSGGFYGSFTVPDNLDPGFYTIKYKRSNHTESIDFQVANFRRLSFQVKVTKPNIETYYAGDPLSFTVNASYLSGGAMSGVKCTYYWVKSSLFYHPPGNNWKSYRFGTSVYEGNTPLGEGSGTLNQDGELIVKQNTETGNHKGSTYSYSLYAAVEDIDRQVIQGFQSAVIHPASFYLGARFSGGSDGWWSPFIKKGEKVEVNTIFVSPNGQLFKMKTPKTIHVKTYRITWKVAQQQGVYNDINSRYEKVEELEKEETMTTTEATAKFFLTTEKSGPYKLALECEDDSGRTALTEFDFYATGSDWFYWSSEGANDISMIADKNIYESGDTANLLVQSSLPEGSYLLTFEREGILEEKIINLKGSANLIQIPIRENYVPVFYVALSSFSLRTEAPSDTYEKPDLGKPKGYFGIVQLRVATTAKEITLEIKNSQSTYTPGSEAEILIKASKNGKPLADTEITFLAADRGVLDLINYHVPNPLEYFYDPDKFPLGVLGADSRALLIDPVTYEVKDLQGGDGSEDDKIKKRKDFRPTAIFEPYLKTDRKGEVRVKFTLPDSLTTFRSTALAVKNENFGIQESEILVQNPINIRTALPRKLRVRDTSQAGVIATNLTAKEEEVTVTAQSDLLKIDGETTKKVRIPANSSREIAFKIAAVTAGEANISFTTISRLVKERLEGKMTVESPVIKETFTTVGKIDPKKDGKNTSQEGLIIPKDIVPNYGSLTITLDDTKLNTLSGSVKYLWDYPYGCLEQRSSKIFPLVVFGEHIKNFISILDVKGTVERELSLWAKYQNSDGGFPFWLEGGMESSYFISTKVALTLYYAKKNNFTIPASIRMDTLISYIQGMAKYSDYEKLYSLFVQSLWGRNVYLQAEEFNKKKEKLDAAELGFLSLTYWNLNKKDVAKNIFYRLKNFIKIGTQTIDLADKDNGYYFSSEINKLALLAMIYNRIDENSEVIPKIVTTLMQKQKNGYWKNTYATSWVIQAFAQLYESEGFGESKFVSKVDINGQNVMNQEFNRKKKNLIQNIIGFFTTDNDGKPSTYTADFPLNGTVLGKLKQDQLYPLNLKLDGKGILYYTLSLNYALPFELVFPRDEGFSIYTEIQDLDHKPVANPNELKVGETYRMKVILSSSKKRNYVALRIPVPSGADILDASFVTTAVYADKEEKKEQNNNRYNWWNYYKPIQKIYDNEVQYLFDYFYNGVEEMEFLFRTTTPGIYPTPPVTASCMYEEEVFGRTSGMLYYLVP